MKFDKYRSFTSNNPDRTFLSREKSFDFYQYPNDQFFKCFCTTICATSRRLDMRGCVIHEKIRRYFEDIDVPALLIFLKKNQDIVHINLANNNISDSGFNNLLHYAIQYKHIEILDLQNNNITKKGTERLLNVGELMEIKNLNLEANKFGVEASINVALFLLKNDHIVTLNVAEVNQTASSLIYFVMALSSEQEVSNKSLRSLDISRPNPGCMYHFDSAHFADVIGRMLKYNTYLRALHLQKYNFSCHDIENMMSNATFNNTLYLLDLANNNIGDHGIEHITSWLVKRPALKALILSRNIITDYGARSLSFTVPFSRLLVLDVSYNKITDDGMVDILNTVKKSPMLRHLRIFGNCIGHPTAKIITRMLTFQCLQQENIDVRPYRVDHKWYFARHGGEMCKKEYSDIPYELFLQKRTVSVKQIRPNRKYYKYNYAQSINIKVQQSYVSMISRILSTTHVKGCKCCYCLKCEAPHFDELCRDPAHPDDCTCCKCKTDSDSSIDKSILDRIVPVLDVMKNISYILKRVDSEVQDKILRWINIDEDVLEEDLNAINDEPTTEEASTCTCSWLQLSITSLQNYLQGSSSKNLLIIPKNYTVCPNYAAKVSSIRYCANV